MADAIAHPVTTLPGHIHELPKGAICDHPGCKEPAVVRVQGETDSLGCELIDLCDEHNQVRQEQEEDHEGVCNFCQAFRVVKPFRDPEEGRSGPVYQVCEPCRGRALEAFVDVEEY